MERGEVQVSDEDQGGHLDAAQVLLAVRRVHEPEHGPVVQLAPRMPFHQKAQLFPQGGVFLDTIPGDASHPRVAHVPRAGAATAEPGELRVLQPHLGILGASGQGGGGQDQ